MKASTRRAIRRFNRRIENVQQVAYETRHYAVQLSPLNMHAVAHNLYAKVTPTPHAHMYTGLCITWGWAPRLDEYIRTTTFAKGV